MNTAAAYLSEPSREENEWIALLWEEGQEHLFTDWSGPGSDEEAKRRFLAQVAQVDRAYPGGLRGYLANGRRLLAEACRGDNPYGGLIPMAPETVDLSRFDGEYDRMEAVGVGAFGRVGVVLVAGGLGERLGYSGIKLGMPVESLEGWTYLRLYAENLLAMEARMEAPHPVPLVIMTSEDTHAKTMAELEAHAWFGLHRDQVHVVKQELVPALADNAGRLAKAGPYRLELKPHGHGDVHLLLHQSGLAEEFLRQGLEHLVFIQDTNGQVFNALPAALGVSIDRGFDFNSLAVKRVPGEAVGGLARLVGKGVDMTVNVEYNQLDPLLRATMDPKGDVAGKDGFSVFPGNINVLVVRLGTYVEILRDSRGVVAEFVNPKYADSSRTRFQKPTRLETLMQDLPRLFGPERRVGVTVFERSWCFSANKNRVEDAAAKHAAKAPPESAATAESDFYKAGRMRLVAAGVRVEESPERQIRGVPYTDGPRVLLRPSFAMTLREVREKVHGGRLVGTATLVVEDPEVRLSDVVLGDGEALVLRKPGDPWAPVPAPRLRELSEEELSDPSTPETTVMRGYCYE